MKLVILESPFAGNIARNVAYARKCLLDSINLGEAPIASHLLYPQVLNDNAEPQRQRGIGCGLAWLAKAELQVFYVDYGWSRGMFQAEHEGKRLGIPQEYREIGK